MALVKSGAATFTAVTGDRPVLWSSGTAAAGNLLVALVHLSTAQAAWNDVTGWTRQLDTGTTGNLGSALFWKISDGTETGFTYNVATSSSGGITIVEYDDDVTAVGILSAHTASQLASTALSISTGSVSPSSAGLLVAAASIDNTASDTTSATWSDSFVEDVYNNSNGTSGRAPGSVASRAVGSGGTYSSTYTWSPTVDEAWAGVLFFPAVGGGGGISGTSTLTLAALTTAAAAALAIAGSTGATLAALTADSAAVLPIAGGAAVTLGALTAAGEGGFAASSTGSAAIDLVPLTAASAGALAVQGAASATLDALTSTASGVLQVIGAVGATLAPLTATAAGTFGSVVSGALEATLGALTAASSGSLVIAALSGATLAPLTTVAAAVLPIAGAGAVTLAALSSAAAAAVLIAAIGSGILAPLTAAAAGTVGGAAPRTIMDALLPKASRFTPRRAGAFTFSPRGRKIA